MQFMNQDNGVDLYTGKAAFSVNITSIPRRNGLNFQYNIFYNGNACYSAEKWNAEAPAGVMGLGWMSPFDMIFIDTSRAGSLEQSVFLMRNGTVTRLLYVGDNENEGLFYKTEEYSFWKIVYYPKEEKWEITNEDGDIYTYGDSKCNRNPIQWTVEWAGWLGTSNRTERQEKTANAWNLSQISNRFSDSVVFYYSNDEVPVGNETGMCYTQASYLKKIQGIRGDSLEFIYLNKDSSEYQQSYPASSCVYQQYYEKKYLDSMLHKSPDGAIMVTYKFDYDFIGEELFKKRMLTSIKEIYPGEKYLPGIEFAYYGRLLISGGNTSDILNSSSGALYGAIRQITVPKGGTITYLYDSVIIGNSGRNVSADPPESPGVSYGNPRFYFEDDYSVITWYGNNSTLAVQTYFWDGRWLKKEYLEIDLESMYDLIRVNLSESCFTISMGQCLYSFTKDVSKAGDWILGRIRNKAGAGTNPPAYAVYSSAEYEGYIIGVGCPSYGNTLDAEINSLDFCRKQINIKYRIQSSLYRTDELMLYPGKDFTVIRAVARTAGRKNVNFSVIRWNRNFQNIEWEDWGITFFEEHECIPEPEIYNSLVVIGQTTYRFDGVIWNYKNISEITGHTGSKTEEKVLFGEDIALRKIQTPDSCIYELVSYNPEKGQWTIPDGMSIVSEGSSLGCAIMQAREETVRWVLLAGKLWYREPEGNWKEKFTIPDVLSEKDAETIQFPSHKYFIYQVNTGQRNVKTVIYFIENGQVVTQPTALPGENVFLAESLTGLAGRNSFVSYSAGVQGEKISLRRVVSGDVKGRQTGFIVKTQILSNGYSDIVNSYRFYEDTACIDSSGHICRFNKVRMILGTYDSGKTPFGYTEFCYYNGLTPDESPSSPYPSDSDYTNAVDYYSIVKGLRYSTEIYDCYGNLAASLTDFWRVYIHFSEKGPAAFYTRKNKQEKMIDGVTGITEYLYSRETGLLIETSMSNYNTLEEQEKFIQQFKYWWEVYDTQKSMNLLTPVIQIINITQNITNNLETITGIHVTTWKEDWGYGKGKWFPYKSFCSLSGEVKPFTAWGENDLPPAYEWLESGTNESITPSGMILESQNVQGIIISRIYDKDDISVIAEVQNASLAGNDLSYLGFEPYEDTGCWGTSSKNTLEDYVVDWDCCTGSRCLRLNTQSVIGVFHPENCSRSYVFSFNAKVESGFDSNKGKAVWEIAVYRFSDNTEVETAMTLDLSAAEGVWTYFQKIIDLETIGKRNNLPGNTALYFIIKGYNLNQEKFCLVDNLRVIPSDAIFGAAVYEPSDLRIKSVLDNNGQTVKILYNEFSKPEAIINAGKNINAIAINAYSRNLFGIGYFKPQFPNLNLLLGTASESRYLDFSEGSLKGWKFTVPADWCISKNKLVYTGANSEAMGERALLDELAYTNFAFRVIVKRKSETLPSSVAAGDGYYHVRWQEDSSRWELIRFNTSSSPEILAALSEVGFKEEWIFIVVDGFVMFFADGIPLFCCKYVRPAEIPADYGKPVLYINKPGTFSNIMILREPQLSIGFEDGFGTTMQSMALAGRENSGIFGGDYSVDWQGAFFDELGRYQYICNPLTSKVSIAPYIRDTGNTEIIEGDTDTYLYDSQGNKLSKNGYLTADVIDYYTQTYEPSPLSRVSKILSPRRKASDPELFTTDITRTGSPSIEMISPSTASLPARFFVEKSRGVQKTDLTGTKSYTEKIIMYDLMGKPIRELEGEEGLYKEKRYIYDPAGNLAAILPPDYFHAPPGSKPTAFIDSMEYTFNGLLKKYTAPDSKTTQYIYDKAGKIRFILDSEGAKQEPQRILYIKYDSLKRIVENGYLCDQNYQWKTDIIKLTLYADNPRFPITDRNFSQDPDYSEGLWKKKFFYDVDVEYPDKKYLLGRLWKVLINNGGESFDEEYYGYDSMGNIISKSVKAGSFDGKVYEFTYKYNNQGQVMAVTYPSLQMQEPFKAGYYYDRLGRLACIGEVVESYPIVDPSNPPTPPESRYASYYYDSSGFIVRESINNSPVPSVDKAIIRDYSINHMGKLNKISDPYFEETLDYYEDGGYGGFRYYDGNIASLSFDYKEENSKSFLKYNYQFQYDTAGCLLYGINSLSDAWSYIDIPDDSYDANGNILRQKRGATTRTYRYASPEMEQINNRVLNTESSIHASMDFEGVAPSGVISGSWSWGSSNGGVSESIIYTNDKHSGTQCLKLTGGSFGHYEFLICKTYFEPVQNFKLSYWIKTDSEFENSLGDAGWFISIISATGGIFTKRIKTIAASDDWINEQVEIDLIQLSHILGRGEEVCYATLELRNAKEAYNQGNQVYLLIDDITVEGSAVSQNYEYNENGDIIKSANRGIDIIYDPVSGLPATIQSYNNDRSLEYAYDSGNQKFIEEFKSSDSCEEYKKLYLNGLNNHPLMEIVDSGGKEKTICHVYSENGLLASKSDEKWLYPIKDHLHSTRMLVDEDGCITNWYDYMPFGELIQSGKADSFHYLYTGQEYNEKVGLYHYPARLYDSSLKRFYEVDPVRQYSSPYVFVGNNPVNRIDPSGCIDIGINPVYLVRGGFIAGSAFLGYYILQLYRLSKMHDASEGKISLNSFKIIQDYTDPYVSYEWNWVQKGYKKRERIGILQETNNRNIMRLYNPVLKEEKLVPLVLAMEEYEINPYTRKFNYVLMPVNGKKEIRLSEVNPYFEDRDTNIFHSELARGLKVDCAGELIIYYGSGHIGSEKEVYLNPKTGHYYKLKGDPAYHEFENCPNIVIEEMRRLGYTNIKNSKYEE